MFSSIGRHFSCTSLMLILLLFACGTADAQQTSLDSINADSLHKIRAYQARQDSTLNSQYDLGDLFHHVFHPKKIARTASKKSGITIIPNVGSNPTVGSQIGIKAVAGKKLGTDSITLMSIAATSASITTKGIIYFYLNHNIYTPLNKWNLQGSLVASKTVNPDFGLGIGRPSGLSEADHVLANGERKAYILHSFYFSFREKVYKNIGPNLFAGAGVAFDVRKSIEDRNSVSDLTPYKIYSSRYGFNPESYSANGLLFDLQYTTRDNQNRAYKGIYANLGIRTNQSWLGSSRNALVLSTDFRKYFSLSAVNPEHVLAVWNWSSYVVSGTLPYLELPGTGKDPAFRSGRGYTIGYFTGTQYNYSEAEYRFPITRNKFISGVAFVNLQTANDKSGTRLFQVWQAGGGGGLRVLFNKATRTNLSLDYAWGKFGSRGFFLGLNEAF